MGKRGRARWAVLVAVAGATLGLGIVLFFLLRSSPSDDLKPLPAEAAGTSTESGPGVPAGFQGDPNASIPLTPAVRSAIDTANELAKARAARGRGPLDLGFATSRPTR